MAAKARIKSHEIRVVLVSMYQKYVATPKFSWVDWPALAQVPGLPLEVKSHNPGVHAVSLDVLFQVLRYFGASFCHVLDKFSQCDIQWLQYFPHFGTNEGYTPANTPLP